MIQPNPAASSGMSIILCFRKVPPTVKINTVIGNSSSRPIAGGSSMGASVVLHQIQGFHPRVMELTAPDLFEHPFIFQGKCAPLTQYRFKNITQMTALWYISSQCFVYLRSGAEDHTGKHEEIETGRQRMGALTRTCLLGAIWRAKSFRLSGMADLVLGTANTVLRFQGSTGIF